MAQLIEFERLLVGSVLETRLMQHALLNYNVANHIGHVLTKHVGLIICGPGYKHATGEWTSGQVGRTLVRRHEIGMTNVGWQPTSWRARYRKGKQTGVPVGGQVRKQVSM